MKKLKNPPDEYKDAYDAVSDLYDAFQWRMTTVYSRENAKNIERAASL